MNFYKLLQSIYSKRNLSILMVSHDLHLVMSSTNEVICLNRHICCHGKKEHVSSDPAFLELLGAAGGSNNLAIYAHRHNHGYEITGNMKPSE